MSDTDIRLIMFDLAKIVDGAVAGDKEKVIAYVGQMGSHFRDMGKIEFANRIDQILGKRPNPTLSIQ